jgi:hypothetical protein
MPAVDLAIALGQALGLAVACGLVPLLPVAVGALASLFDGTPGAVDAYDDSPVVAAACVLGVLGAVGAAWLPTVGRVALGAVGGGAAAQLVGGDEVPWALIAVGAVLGAASAWAVAQLLEGALKSEGTRGGLAAISGAAGLGAAVLALIPFVGYALVVALAWLLFRTRRRDQGQYAGLRVLR